MRRVRVYLREGCHLCEEALEVLDRLRREIPFELVEVDVDSDPSLAALFGERVPVVTVDGQVASQLLVREDQVRRQLAEEGAGGSA